MNSKTINIIIGISLVVVLGLIFMYSGKSGGAPQSGLTAERGGASNAIAVFLRQISAIRKITMSKDVLSRPELDSSRGLRDQGRELVQEEMGRDNPFAPIIGGQSASLPSALGSSVQNPPAPEGATQVQIPIQVPKVTKPLSD